MKRALVLCGALALAALLFLFLRPHPERAAFLPEAQNDFCVGIIGGADGPVAIVVGEAAQGKLHTVCSSLHFAPVGHVGWRVGFRETPWEAGTFDLL